MVDLSHLTEAARRAVEIANSFCTHSGEYDGNGYVGSEHLLMGLILENKGVASRVLVRLGVDNLKLEFANPKELSQRSEDIRVTPMVSRIISTHALDELKDGETLVDTEHLLLGICRESQGVAIQLLQNYGVSKEEVREAVDLEKRIV